MLYQKCTLIAMGLFTLSQSHLFAQDIIKAKADQGSWTGFNREVDFKNDVIHLNAASKDGILWLNDVSFRSGTIEVDIKGKDLQGRSFVGIAFHGKGNETFDGVYFRPFNFKSPERKSHSVQYISMPENDWSLLRQTFPGKFENEVSPVPDPDDWFHAKIIINDMSIKVYVNGASHASLEVEKISSSNDGQIGLWVGNGSEGWFKNFTITPK